MAKVLERFWIGIVCAVAGCVSPAGGPASSEGMRRLESLEAIGAGTAAVERKSDAVVIGRLRLRDVQLVVLAGDGTGKGLQFGVLDRNGNPLRESLTEFDLRAHFPQLHQAFRQSRAAERPLLDARVDPKYLLPAGKSQARALGE